MVNKVQNNSVSPILFSYYYPKELQGYLMGLYFLKMILANIFFFKWHYSSSRFSPFPHLHLALSCPLPQSVPTSVSTGHAFVGFLESVHLFFQALFQLQVGIGLSVLHTFCLIPLITYYVLC